MPKDPIAARALKQQRLAKAAALRGKNFGPSSLLKFHVIGNGSPGNPSCIYLVTDHHRYLFNCGEGTQRLCNEHGFKISKLEHIFITQPTWKNIGGLPGMCMTLQSIGVPSINIHSPTDIVRLFEMTRLFNVNQELSVIQKTVEDLEFSDKTMKVRYIPLLKPCSKVKPEIYQKRMKLNSDDRDIVLSFICTLHPKPGPLDLVKCIELNVPRGPLLGDLKRGIDITLPDGTLVKSSDVTCPPEPGSIFLIIDCPSVEYIDSLVTNREILRHTIPGALAEDIPVCIVHFSPPEVIDSEKYMKWISSMPTSVKHFLLNHDNPLLSFKAPAEFQTKLATLDHELFPPLFVASHDEDVTSESSQLVKCPTLTSFDVRTPFSNQEDTPLIFDPEEAKNQALAVDEYPEAVERYKETVFKMNFNKCNIMPIVTFFGTASAIPGKDRNTSCIHVTISDNSSMIMDCGEQSFGQMLRFFGTERIGDELSRIKCIFVSHLHADHHLGLITILKERNQLTNKPVVLIGPSSIREWLMNYSMTYENISYMFTFHESQNFFNESANFLKDIDLVTLRTFRVEHCRDSFGVTITTKGNINGVGEDPFKIVYSGDAMPSPQLVHAGMNCDLLIHEATMEDDLADEARIKRHSTTSQAIEMGIKCKARNVILTHFSQRYAKIPIISQELLKKSSNVSTAFDNMRIHRYDYDKLPHLHVPLRVLFNEYIERNDQRLKRREYREKIIGETISGTTSSEEVELKSSTNS